MSSYYEVQYCTNFYVYFYVYFFSCTISAVTRHAESDWGRARPEQGVLFEKLHGGMA